MKKRKTYKLIEKVFVLLIIVFLIKYLTNIDWVSIKKIEVNYFIIVVATAIYLFNRFLLPLCWLILLNGFGYKIKNIKEMYYVYSKAWLGRYIPGKITWIGGRVLFGRKMNIPKSILGITSLLEIYIQIVASFIFSFLSIGLSGYLSNLDFVIKIFFIVSFFLFALLMFPNLYISITTFLYKKVRKKDLEFIKLKINFLLKTFFIYLVVLTIGGLSLNLIVFSFTKEIDVQLFLYISGIYSLSGVLGILTFFAPSGIGVREGIQIALLKPIFGKVVIVISILARIISVIDDIFFFFIANVFNKMKFKTLINPL
jgi:glycosyltransferase 2 family protein